MPALVIPKYASDASLVPELPGHQEVNLKLQMLASAFALPAPESDKFVQASFADSVAGTGALLHAASFATIGWYLESAQLCVWLQTDDATVDVHRHLREAEIYSSSPQSDNGSGSVSNGCSVNFGGNLGVFDGKPLGGVSVGISASQATTQNFKDFTFVSANQPGLLRHTWSLTMDGYDASVPAKSLWGRKGPPFDPVDTWWRALPGMATGDVPFTSYVLIRVPPDWRQRTVFLCASLAVQYVYLDAVPAAFDDNGKWRKDFRMVSHATAVDMAKATPDAARA